MAQTNYTPIQLYYSTTAAAVPVNTNLLNGELAINITDGKLYYKDNSGTVQVIATKGAGTIGGSNTQIQYNNNGALAGSVDMTYTSGTNTVLLTRLNLTNALGAIYGGTGLSTYTTGDLLYSSASNTLAKLAIGTANYILTVNSGGTNVQWSAPSSISVSTATNTSATDINPRHQLLPLLLVGVAIITAVLLLTIQTSSRCFTIGILLIK
jgi:hypothetical protein